MMLNEKLQDIRIELQGKWGILAVLLLGWLFCFKYIMGGNLPLGMMIGLLPLVLLVGGLFINKPIVLFAVLFTVNYFIMGAGRYLIHHPLPLPVSVIMDILYIMLVCILLVKCVWGQYEIRKIEIGIFFIYLIWVGFCSLQAFNNTCGTGFEFTAWFKDIRPYAFHSIYIIIIFSILFRKVEHIKWFLYIWAIFTLLAVAKGYWQRNHGFDQYEWWWLWGRGATTHLIHSGVRYFSFFSDAANFGSNMAFCTVTFGLVAIYIKGWKSKIFFLGVALSSGYGLMISGTRSAIFVALAGFVLYTLLSKSWKLFLFSLSIIILAIGFLKFTTIGDENRLVHRMRTAFDPTDASLQVRLENQKAMKAYMKEAPWGIGLGRDESNVPINNKYRLVSTTATDSTLVYIWTRTGVIGLTIYLLLFVATMIGGCYIVLFKIKNKELRGILTAMLCGAACMMVAAYGNNIYLQYPNGLLIFGCETLVFLGPYFDKQLSKQKEEKEKEDADPQSA